jgi:DNA-binding FrmR family transcriptional regulator
MMNELERQVIAEWMDVMRQATAELKSLVELSPSIFETHLVDSRKREALSRIKKALDEIWECIDILEESIMGVEEDD